MAEYISRAFLTINGNKVVDFKAVSEGEYEVFRQIKLMTTTGHAKVTPRYTVEVDYVVPLVNEFDWSTLQNGTLNIQYEDGWTSTYTGVHTLKIGAAKSDGENDVVKVISLGAENRTKTA